MKVLISFCVLCLAISGFAQNLCYLPNGQAGYCVPWRNCHSTLHHNYYNPYSSSHTTHLSNCGYNFNNEPLYCCNTIVQTQPLNVAPMANYWHSLPRHGSNEPRIEHNYQNFQYFTPKPNNYRYVPTRTNKVNAPDIKIIDYVFDYYDSNNNHKHEDKNSKEGSSYRDFDYVTPKQIKNQVQTNKNVTEIEIIKYVLSAFSPKNGESSIFNSKSHQNFNLLPKEQECGREGTDNRIYGGNDTKLNEFPWMILLEYRKNGVDTGFNCGGALINNKYVLTAAHCVAEDVVKEFGQVFRVRLGEHDLRTGQDCQIIEEGDEKYADCAEPHQDIEVEQIIIHPYYNFIQNDVNDIALLRLKSPAKIAENVQPICLPLNGQESIPGHELFVSGWGRTNETNFQSFVKQKTKVPIFEFDKCRENYGKANRTILKTQFCAGGLKGIDSCSGDSGGPLMTTITGATPIRWYVEGIVSYGPRKCGTEGWPGVYTKVKLYLKWILDNIRA